jgi:hypothetical protein
VKRSVTGRLVAVAAAVLLGGLALVPPPAARAADTGLQIVTSTRYVALPAEKRIAVTIDAVATNTTPDPANGRYYYTAARFAVQPAIKNLSASSGGQVIAARIVDSSAEFTTIEVAFGRAVFHGQSESFRVSFDITDPGGLPNRDVRVAGSLVAFPIWAFGTENTPGCTVTVVIPSGYTVTVEAGTLTSAAGSGGTTILTAPAIPDPYSFFAYVTAEKPGAFRNTTATVAFPDGTVQVLIRAWDDDPDWGTRLGELMSRGLPVLRNLIGLPYLVHGELKVEEAATSRLGDYAGVYNDVTETIDIRYDADGYTALHEAAHTWFNGNLFPDRWIGEAWAEYYGVAAGKAIGTTGDVFTLTPTLQAAKIPLNSWGTIGSEPVNTEDYAYAASYEVAQLIADRATTAGLQKVWQAAHAGAGAYQPVHAAAGAAPEKGVSVDVAGWQQLLDLLEERTGTNYDDLWRTWIVTPGQASLMDARVKARATYADTVTLAGDWELPPVIRYDMGAWDFRSADDLMVAARAVLADRSTIQTRATSLSLTVPDTLRKDFEAGPTFAAADKDAAEQLTALDAIGSATTTLASDPSPVEWVGLLFADPTTQLAAARTAFEDGQATEATAQADAARAEREGAADAGRLRVAVTGGSLLVIDGLAMGALAVRRRRRRTRRERAREEARPGLSPWGPSDEPGVPPVPDEPPAGPPPASADPPPNTP